MNLNVLIVDDEEATIDACSELLRRSGYSARTVRSPSRALSAIFESTPDVVLMNMELAGEDDLDCLDCVNVMREIGFEGVICIITGNDSPVSLIKSAIAGVDSYFVKGNISKIVYEIESLLKAREGCEKDAGGDFHPILDGVFLRSFGLDQRQIELLWKIHSHGYPDDKGLAYEIGIDPNTLTKRLSRIKKKLGLVNMKQVAQLMTALSVFSCRRR